MKDIAPGSDLVEELAGRLKNCIDAWILESVLLDRPLTEVEQDRIYDREVGVTYVDFTLEELGTGVKKIDT